jgi:hypothetical protein
MALVERLMARISTPQIWAQIRNELGTTPATAVVPKDNVLVGEIAIMEYLQIRERRVLERWVDEFALPMIKRPDGIWMTSITAIDQWILMAAKVAYGNKKAEGKTTAQRREAAAQARAVLRS